jgi:cystathionine gamma-synthase
MSDAYDPRTRTVRAALDSDTQFGAVVPPIHLTSTFSFEAFGVKRGYDYTRSGNPTRDALADALADLEGGAGAVVTASGMAAITLVAHLCRAGDLVVAPFDCYGGTFRLLSALARHGMLKVEFIDPTDLLALEAALSNKPRLLWLETPSNPLLRITDLKRACALANAAGALVAVDNTFLSPAWQQPLALGADLVVHSTTKYLNGHSDVVGGAVVARTQTLHEEVTWWANCLGVTGAPFDSFLTLRGLRTLHTRLAAHAANAEAIVQLLRSHPAVERVYYPGLKDHPGHAIAAVQQRSPGAMLSFELTSGLPGVRVLVENLKLFSLAESLGGVESLIAHPATMTHAAMEPAARARAGISDGLVRVSVGIEAPGDLLADLAQGLERALALAAPRTRAAGGSG